MKYEAVFGDYKFSSPACEVAIQSSFGEIIEMGFTKPLVITEGWGVIAMRRIIPEPKRWTVEDKKAGRLPEVGCNVDTFTGECVVIGRDSNLKHVAVQHHDDGYMDILHISKINPIETPEEKAQREEDEFVKLMIDLASESQLMSCGFKDGVISAYRKLKGGE
jgi:hypothetical protein